MKKIIYFKKYFAVLSLMLAVIMACSGGDDTPAKDEKEEEVTKSLTANIDKIDFQNTSSNIDIIITTDVDTWVISSSGASWLTFSQTSGGSGTITVTVTAEENTELTERTATVTINANSVTAIKIPVTQLGAPSTSGFYPDYNTDPIPADNTGMTSTAEEIASRINLGWNTGNSLEATGSETAWGNPEVTKELIDAVKLNGFNAVRIPCSWNQYSNQETAEISEDWLNRVKEVVQYCIDNDMYTIINIHWDGGWLENDIKEATQEEVNAKQKAFWEQIATHLRDFDEYLLFASANEPNVEDATQMAVLNSYHQTFIDAVRATGGKNAYRTLIVQGPSTDIEKTNNLMTTLPTDTTVENRMMVEVHYYTPWQFAGMTKDESWGNMFYYWGSGYESTTDTSRNATWGLESELGNFFQLMKSQFVDNGIPVVLGEFGAIRRTTLTGADLQLHLDSRAYYLKTVVQEAKANGLLPFYWDEGSRENNGFGIIDRRDNTVFDQQILNALIEGAK